MLRLSNLVGQGELVMSQEYLDLMREYLTVIHNEFAVLYDVVGAEGFAMDIEYKVTASDQLIIKQARPWVSFWADINGDKDLGIREIISPVSSSTLGSDELVSVSVGNFGLEDMSDFELELIVDGQSEEVLSISETIEPFSSDEFEFTAPQDFSELGAYSITCILSHQDDEYDKNDTLDYVLNRIPDLDGMISIGAINGLCGGALSVHAAITNAGDDVLTSVMFQVLVNGQLMQVIEEAGHKGESISIKK